mmetsp:Transcript_10909/g.13659  ORF Transcript_10909/g.13659 Transcript_10909/m.13659 type:complete len:82 (+) Transcript_10909:237-482(+)
MAKSNDNVTGMLLIDANGLCISATGCASASESGELYILFQKTASTSSSGDLPVQIVHVEREDQNIILQTHGELIVGTYVSK